METYDFNRTFRLKVLSLLLDPIWVSRYGTSIIRPEFFEQDDEELIASAILGYYETYGVVPRDPDDILVMCEGKYEDIILEVYDQEFEEEFVSDIVIQFAREQAAKIAILDSIDDVKRGNVNKVLERMEVVLSIGRDIRIPGIDVVDDSDKWLTGLWTDKVRTGWYHIDVIMEGGLAPGELGIILAPTNRGKSMALVNIGFGAAGIGSAKKVVHITHEMGAKVVAKRYSARMTFRFPTLHDDVAAYEDELHEAARRLMPGKVRVLDLGGCNLIDIQERLDSLRAEGYEFDLIIDDYPDLVMSPVKYGEKRFELSHIYKWMRNLGRRYDVPVWAASQSNRESFSKEVVTMQHVAEDFGKVRVADVVISICQTPEEEAADGCRLFMAKVRDGSKHYMLDAKYYGKSQAIITTGFTKEKEKDA